MFPTFLRWTYTIMSASWSRPDYYTMISGSAAENYYFQYHYIYNLELGTFCYIHNKTITKYEDFLDFMDAPKDARSIWYKLLKTYQNFDLTNDESVLVAALYSMIGGETLGTWFHTDFVHVC